jgi:alkanesulfonate monooxygenase
METPGAAARYRLEKVLAHSPASRPDLAGWTRFARAAEQAGIESVLISFSRHEPDPMLVSCALGQAVDKLRFIVAYRSGLLSPTTFVQQINTLSTLLHGRVAVNLVAGSSAAEQQAYGDFLKHDERYARAGEFLQVCHALWRNRASRLDFEGGYYRVKQGLLATPFLAPNRAEPEIYVSGHSEQAEQLVLSQGSCWLRGADTPAQLAPIVARSRARGVEVGLRLCVLCRETREKAIETAESLVPHCEIGLLARREKRDDSTMYRQSETATDAWISPMLWTRLVHLCGPVWATLLGTPEEVATAIIEYKRIGISQFILSGWPEIEEVLRFGRDVLPLVRRLEHSSPKPR